MAPLLKTLATAMLITSSVATPHFKTSGSTTTKVSLSFGTKVSCPDHNSASYTCKKGSKFQVNCDSYYDGGKDVSFCTGNAP